MIRNRAVSRLRATVGAMGGLLLLGVGGAALADDVQQDGVDLDVTIATTDRKSTRLNSSHR